MDRSTGWQGWIMSPAIIAALFMLALSPLLVDHLLFHPDERHYVDAALQMQETGEWLTPRTADGELRLQKPILAYWFVAAGTSLWDPSPFSTRVLFLLTGGALIWWGARAAWEATGSRAATALTAFMLACHPALIISAVRSLPDVLMGTFVTMSLAGFVAIIARGRADWGPLLTAYLGGALAILAKGSPAIVFVAYGTLYIAYYRRTLFRSQWSRFAVAATLCCALGGSWFAAMHWRYGAELVEQFVVDQGHPYRFASDTLQVLLQGLLIALTLVLSFGLILFPAARPIWNRRRDAAAICSRPVNHFLIGWIGLFLACAACINHVSLRYLLPVAGPTAILLATLIVELEGPRMRRNLRGLAWVSLALIPIAATIVLLLSQNQVTTSVVLALVVLAVGLWWLFRQMRFTSVLRATSVTASAMLLILLVVSGAALSSLGESFGFEMTEAIEQELGHDLDRTRMTLIGEPAHAARIRICSGGRLKVDHRYARDLETAPATPLVAALNRDDLLEIPAAKLLAVPCGLDKLNAAEAWDAFQAGHWTEYLEAHRRRYYVAIRANADSSLPPRVAGDLSTSGQLR